MILTALTNLNFVFIKEDWTAADDPLCFALAGIALKILNSPLFPCCLTIAAAALATKVVVKLALYYNLFDFKRLEEKTGGYLIINKVIKAAAFISIIIMSYYFQSITLLFAAAFGAIIQIDSEKRKFSVLKAPNSNTCIV